MRGHSSPTEYLPPTSAQIDFEGQSTSGSLRLVESTPHTLALPPNETPSSPPYLRTD